jgi:Uncharacterized conserved protein (DUF2163)
MPKILTPAMRAHLDAETTRLAAIWRITRKDGQQFFFTDHDRDIVFGGEVYRADAGFERTAIRSDAGFAVDNLDLVGVFAEGGIVADEVRAGLFDGAEIALSFVNWQDPDGHGEIRLRRGTLGETRLTPQGYFHAELRGLSQPLAQSTLEVFSPNCRADLGDHRCKFPIQPPELERDQAVSAGAFYRVPTAAGTGSARYEDRIYEVIDAGTTASSQPAYDTTIGATTIDGTATLKAHDSFTRVAFVDAVTDHRVFTLISGFGIPFITTRKLVGITANLEFWRGNLRLALEHDKHTRTGLLGPAGSCLFNLGGEPLPRGAFLVWGKEPLRYLRHKSRGLVRFDQPDHPRRVFNASSTVRYFSSRAAGRPTASRQRAAIGDTVASRDVRNQPSQRQGSS